MVVVRNLLPRQTQTIGCTDNPSDLGSELQSYQKLIYLCTLYTSPSPPILFQVGHCYCIKHWLPLILLFSSTLESVTTTTSSFSQSAPTLTYFCHAFIPCTHSYVPFYGNNFVELLHVLALQHQSLLYWLSKPHCQPLDFRLPPSTTHIFIWLIFEGYHWSFHSLFPPFQCASMLTITPISHLDWLFLPFPPSYQALDLTGLLLPSSVFPRWDKHPMAPP